MMIFVVVFFYVFIIFCLTFVCLVETPLTRFISCFFDEKKLTTPRKRKKQKKSKRKEKEKGRIPCHCNQVNTNNFSQ